VVLLLISVKLEQAVGSASLKKELAELSLFISRSARGSIEAYVRFLFF